MKNKFPNYCEICNESKIKTLQKHHIIERTEINSNNSFWNLTVICANCHLLVHNQIIEIIGLFPYTNEFGRILVYKKNGIPNIEGIDKPYYKCINKSIKVI